MADVEQLSAEVRRHKQEGSDPAVLQAAVDQLQEAIATRDAEPPANEAPDANTDEPLD